MFTGIVRGLCRLTEVLDEPGLRRLVVLLDEGPLSAGIELGASIAINGICLTVVRVEMTDGRASVWFDCMQETLDRTTIGRLQPGDMVNVERAQRVGDEIGGHHVSGHIDCAGVVDRIDESPGNREVFVRLPEDADWHMYLVSKGWIAIDGVSLTVVKVTKEYFSVCLIPETRQRTTLGTRQVGDRVNLEFDGNAKTIVATMQRLLPALVAAHLSGTTPSPTI